MYITKLVISNYRNLVNLELDLKPITLIIGENNVGKSNLLEAIGLIFSQDVSFFKKRVLDISDFNRECVVELKKQILNESINPNDIEYPTIKVEAYLTDWSTEQSGVIGDWLCTPPEGEPYQQAKLTYEFSPVHSFNKIDEIVAQREFLNKVKAEHGEEQFDQFEIHEKLDLITFPISKYHYSIKGGEGDGGSVNTFHLNQIKFELLGALRDATRELSADGNGRLLFRILNAKEERDYQDLKAELLGLQNAINNNPALTAIKKGISDQLELISLKSEHQTNEVDFLFSLPNVSDLLKKISLIYGEELNKIDSNGTGRNNLLFMSLMLSYMEDSFTQSRVFFRILGIEEPEAHLHANLQNHLSSNFEKLMKEGDGSYRKDMQVLLTSHSSHITTKLDFENTVVLYNSDDNELKAHYILEGFDEPKSKELKYLNKYFDAINTNMFFSRRVILVEGISEQLLIPEFFKTLTGHDLEYNRCAIINVNGLAFRNFLEIISNGYFIKATVITDSDIGTETEGRADKLIEDYSSNAKICIKKTVESTFEKDLISANISGNGASTLKDVIKEVRPVSGKAFVDAMQEGDDLLVEPYFALIEKYKSEFAYRLKRKMENNEEHGITVPSYIKEGIEFLNE